MSTPSSSQRGWAALGLVLGLVVIAGFLLLPSPWKLGMIPLLLVLGKFVAPRAMPSMTDNNPKE